MLTLRKSEVQTIKKNSKPRGLLYDEISRLSRKATAIDDRQQLGMGAAKSRYSPCRPTRPIHPIRGSCLRQARTNGLSPPSIVSTSAVTYPRPLSEWMLRIRLGGVCATLSLQNRSPVLTHLLRLDVPSRSSSTANLDKAVKSDAPGGYLLIRHCWLN